MTIRNNEHHTLLLPDAPPPIPVLRAVRIYRAKAALHDKSLSVHTLTSIAAVHHPIQLSALLKRPPVNPPKAA